MYDTMEYAQERHRERVAQGLVLARLERVREAGRQTTGARRAGRARRAVAQWLVALGTRLASSAETGNPRADAEPVRP